jgi:hypothetical protein
MMESLQQANTLTENHQKKPEFKKENTSKTSQLKISEK